MCDTPNVILGFNLLDFLALGCRQGYFSLEQLIHNHDDQVEALDSAKHQEEISDDEIRLLQSIVNGFDLKPWADHDTRLRELEDHFFSFIEAKIEPD